MDSHSDHRFHVSVGVDDGVAVLVASGDLDRSAVSEFSVVATGQLDRGNDVVADLSATTIIDSAGLAALIRLHRSAVERGARLDVVIAKTYQLRLFEVADLGKHLNIVHRPTTP